MLCVNFVFIRFKERLPSHSSGQPFPSPPNSNVIYSGAYSDPGYLQMALGAYLTPTSSVYKSVDPYFLSQGEHSSKYIFLKNLTKEIQKYQKIID